LNSVPHLSANVGLDATLKYKQKIVEVNGLTHSRHVFSHSLRWHKTSFKWWF